VLHVAEDRESPASTPASRSFASWRVPVVTWALVVAFAAPVLWTVLRRPSPLASDWASIELRTRDVFSAHPPLLGVYSWFGWAHPGPLPFYLYAVPYRLFGADATAMRIAALLVNGLAIWATVWLLARRGKAALAIGVCAVAATLWGMYAEAIADPWNATIAVLSFLLTIVGCWSILCGDRPAIVVATVAFVFTFQAHIGFGLVLVPIVAMTVVLCMIRLRHSGRTADAVRWFGYAVAVALILCVPLIVDTVRDWPGNLERLVDWSVTNDVPATGFARGAELIGRQTSMSFLRSPRFPIFIDTVLDPLPRTILPGAALILLVGAAVVARWRRLPRELELCVLLLCGWAGGLWAAASVRGPEYEWLFGWMEPLAWLTWAAVALVAWRLLAPRLGRRLLPRSIHVAAAIVAILVVSALAIGAGRRNVDGGFVFPELAAPLKQFTNAAMAAGLEGPVRVDFEGDLVGAGGLHAGLINELDRRGVDIKVDPNQRLQFGDNRADDGSARERLLVRAEVVTEPPPAGARVLSVYDRLTPAERIEVDQLTADLTALFMANGLADKVPILGTPGAVLILLNDPPPAVAAESAALNRLADLRQHGGTRYSLYLLGP
jgi:hypothetical protein